MTTDPPVTSFAMRRDRSLASDLQQTHMEETHIHVQHTSKSAIGKNGTATRGVGRVAPREDMHAQFACKVVAHGHLCVE